MGESDLVGYYTSRYSGEEIDRRLGNAAAPVSNPSLLDNGYFIGGGSQLDGWHYPINQRGQTVYTVSTIGKQYGIDRWWNYSPGTMTLDQTGLVLSPEMLIDQTICPEVAQAIFRSTVTFSVLYLVDGILNFITLTGPFGSDERPIVSDGNCVLSISTQMEGYAFGGMFVEIRPLKSVVLCAAKLEVGLVQTLAHQDEAGNWVLNDQPPNYALELAKCQRYYLKATHPNFVLDSDKIAGYLRTNVQFPVTMIYKPTVTVFGDNTPNRIGNANSGGYYDSFLVEVMDNTISNNGFGALRISQGTVPSNLFGSFSYVASADI